ncbi:sensor histidine kinase [Paenibacillus sinopodophylli]|uniref:sensor histidine kinase n=1 Tax=Paenibacillus sinopodophylli TaxID=1837342 RepID=UPI001FE349EC|nr:histidine kinase [Paenibacillus sinopodophylli]
MSRFSFYRRLQFSFIIFILLPFIAVTFWSYSSVGSNVSDKMTLASQETLNVIANQLEKTIDGISFASVYFSQFYDSDVLERLRGLKDAESFANYETYAHQEKLKAIASILSIQSLDVNVEILLVNNHDRVIMSSQSRPVFTKLPSGLQEEIGKLDPKELTELHWFADGEDGALPDTYYAVRFIVDPLDRERLATLFIGIPADYFRGLLDTGNPAVSITLSDRSGTPIARHDGSNSVSSGSLLTSKTVLSRVGWQLESRMPQSSVVGQINKEFLVSISLVGLFFLFFLILSMLWARQINKPISLLRSSVKQYVGGNRVVRIPVQGKDEVAVLSAAFNQILDEMDELLRRMENEQEEKRLLELQALAAQIRPHFLLNTLNSIKVNLLMAGDDAHGGMIDSLMKLLRAYVRVDAPLELAEEVNILDSYIQVMQIRNRLDIRFAVTLDEGLPHLSLPRLLLQPIVENAIIHGFSARPEFPIISLFARIAGRMAEIEIRDNGRGMSGEAIISLNQRLLDAESNMPAQEKSVGLVNTARRLRVLYGHRARLTAAEGESGGMSFILQIPMQSRKEAEHHDEDHAY